MYYDYSYNHLDWFTMESEHFMVHFQEEMIEARR